MSVFVKETALLCEAARNWTMRWTNLWNDWFHDANPCNLVQQEERMTQCHDKILGLECKHVVVSQLRVWVIQLSAEEGLWIGGDVLNFKSTQDTSCGFGCFCCLGKSCNLKDAGCWLQVAYTDNLTFSFFLSFFSNFPLAIISMVTQVVRVHFIAVVLRCQRHKLLHGGERSPLY